KGKMANLTGKVVLVVAAVATGVMLAAAQAPAQKPQFEVASMKPNAQSGFSRSTMSIAGNRYTATVAPEMRPKSPPGNPMEDNSYYRISFKTLINAEKLTIVFR